MVIAERQPRSRPPTRRDHSQVRPNDVTDHADQWGRRRDHRQSAVRSRIRDHSTGLYFNKYQFFTLTPGLILNNYQLGL